MPQFSKLYPGLQHQPELRYAEWQHPRLSGLLPGGEWQYDRVETYSELDVCRRIVLVQHAAGGVRRLLDHLYFSAEYNTPYGPADGIAFLIQNASTSALGPDGCGIGFGDSNSGCAPPTGGITNSLAIEFNTYLNDGIDPNNNDITIQNCSGTGPNSVDPTCTVLGGVNSNLPSNMSDGNVHSVTINYSGPSTTLIDVILDNVDLFPPALRIPTVGCHSI